MLKDQLNKLVNHYGLWRSTHIMMAVVIIIFIVVLLLELVIPVRLNPGKVDTYNNTSIVPSEHLHEILESKSSNFQELVKIIRPRLFKSSTSLRDKPIADKTIERIKSQLNLQCIMEINGKLVAYVNIKGIGLKKCEVGDLVNDLFTVLNIYKKSIEITIVDHKVTLSL